MRKGWENSRGTSATREMWGIDDALFTVLGLS